MRRRGSPLRRYSLGCGSGSEAAECVSSPKPLGLPMTLHRRETLHLGDPAAFDQESRQGGQPFVCAVCAYGKGNEEPERKRGAKIRT
jgi:hypothetical protein